MARLRVFVHVRDEGGATRVFGPDDEVPAWAQTAISNPHVWAVLPEPVVVSEVPESPEAPPAAVEGADPVPAPSGEGADVEPADEAPAKPTRRTRRN